MRHTTIIWRGLIVLLVVSLSASVFAQVPQPAPIPNPSNLPQRQSDTTTNTPLPDSPYLAFANLPQHRTADGAFVLGEPDAPITLIVFEDPLCPHCQAYHPTTLQFIAEFVTTGEAAFETRSFPTAGGMTTEKITQVNECAEAQRPGGFWEGYLLAYDLAANEGGSFYPDDLPGIYAERLHLVLEDLETCAQDAQQVILDQDYAHLLGVTGTPSVYLRYGNETPFMPESREFEALAGYVREGSVGNDA